MDTKDDEIVSFVDNYIQKENIVCNKPNLFYGMTMNKKPDDFQITKMYDVINRHFLKWSKFLIKYGGNVYD